MCDQINSTDPLKITDHESIAIRGIKEITVSDRQDEDHDIHGDPASTKVTGTHVGLAETGEKLKEIYGHERQDSALDPTFLDQMQSLAFGPADQKI